MRLRLWVLALLVLAQSLTAGGLRSSHNASALEAEEDEVPERQLGKKGKGYKKGAKTPRPEDITLVTVATLDRLHCLYYTLERWQGPALFIIAVQDDAPPSGQRPEWADELRRGRAPGSLQIVRVHPGKDNFGAQFPINKLRNLGIKKVATTHMLYLDVDFIPCFGAYEATKKLLFGNVELAKDKWAALVVPAFSIRGYCRTPSQCVKKFEGSLPVDFAGLRKQLAQNDTRLEVFGGGQAAQHSTNYTAWMTQEEDELRQLLCLTSTRYEPYFVVRKSKWLPRFDTRFTGYGKNKIQWVIHLRYRGWKFSVLPRVFVTHFPHPSSSARDVFFSDKNNRGQVAEQFSAFLEELHLESQRKHYQVSLPLCSKEDQKGDEVEEVWKR